MVLKSACANKEQRNFTLKLYELNDVSLRQKMHMFSLVMISLYLRAFRYSSNTEVMRGYPTETEVFNGVVNAGAFIQKQIIS
jgi:hypothetical protein